LLVHPLKSLVFKGFQCGVLLRCGVSADTLDETPKSRAPPRRHDVVVRDRKADEMLRHLEADQRTTEIDALSIDLRRARQQ
jgi:hypothetical protein